MKFYKLGYFFLSKVNNITESLEKGLDKVVSRGEKNFSVHRKYMNFLRPRKTALDEPLYKLSAGRSMVEMLGVLAIIGVLSVGAIAGYSKAMMKYKLNRQTEQIGSILDYVTINSDKFTHDSSMSFSVLLQKLGVIPVEMIRENSAITDYLYDVFGNQVNLFLNNDGYTSYYGLELSIGKNAHEVCLNLFQMAKLRSANLWHTVFQKDDEQGSMQHAGRAYGDAYCDDTVTCLKDLTLSDMDNLCSVCDDTKSYCRFFFLWGAVNS